jgi:hypothetical protein
MRDINELVDVPVPSWPGLAADLASSFTPSAVLSPDPAQCRATMLQLQVTARSALGAIALNTGGIVLFDGWLRLFGGSGGGPAGLPGMAEVNCFPAGVEPDWSPPGGLVVAQDVLGGVFSLNGLEPAEHGRPGDPGEVVYFSPCTLEWATLELRHSQWLYWIVSGGCAGFYHDLLWPTWRTEVAALHPRDGISVDPFLWTEQAQGDMSSTTRRAVPMEQLMETHKVLCAQLSFDDPGFLGEYRVVTAD